MLAFAITPPAVAVTPVRGTVATDDGPVAVELVAEPGRQARLLTTGPVAKGREVTRLITPSQVLALLLDRRLVFLWPSLTAWAGPDLVALRDRMLTESAAAYARGKALDPKTKKSFNSGKAAATADRADMLSNAGRFDEGIDLLSTTIERWPTRTALERADRSGLVLRQASLLAASGKVDVALARLETFEAQAQSRSEALNVVVNRALLLALSGKYRAALDAVDKVQGMYASYKDTLGGALQIVPGAQRYFDTVRACALNGIGRREEASALMASLAPEGKPRSLLHPVKSNTEVRRLANLCLRDAAGLGASIAESLDRAPLPLPEELLTYVASSFRSTMFDQALSDAARSDPRYAAAAQGIIRPTPPELLPALNSWRE